MSSFINKSGKKFTPKAPARRRAPAAASIAKPPSKTSNTAEPSPAPPSEAGSEIGDRQPTPAVNSGQGAVSASIIPVKSSGGPVSVKTIAPPVDPNGVSIIRESSVAQTTEVSETLASSIPGITSSGRTDYTVTARSTSIDSRVRSRSPGDGATISRPPEPKRRRVDENVGSQTSNTPTGVRQSRSPVSYEVPVTRTSHVPSTSAAAELSPQSTTETSRSITPVQAPAPTIPHPSGVPVAKATPKASTAITMAPQRPSGSEVSKSTNARSKSATTQSPRSSQASNSAQAARSAQALSTSKLIVEYEVPEQPIVSPPSQSTSRQRAATSKSTTPAKTSRPRIPSAVEDDQWQVTTPADLAASSRMDEERLSRSRTGLDNDDNVGSGGTTTPTDSPAASSTTSSARLANAVKRKRKQMTRNAAISRLTGQATASAIDEAVAYSIEGQLPRQLSVRPERPSTDQESSGPRKRVPKRGVREPTPHDNETVVIAPGITRMNDLTQDLRVGIKSDREKKMRAIDWKDVKRRRKEDEIRQATHRGRRDADGQSLNGAADEEEDGLDEDERLERNYERHKQKQGLQSLRLRNVNGEQVLDEASQFIDRHAMQEEELLEEVEEDDLTKKFNVATYATWRRKDPAERVLSHEKWTEDATDRFYDFLSRFGTDFMIISKMFSGRTRRHIKAKFVKEERADPERVKQALLRHLTRKNEGDGWSIEAFRVGAGLSQADLKDPMAVKQELEEIKVKMEEEIEEARKETAENEKQMRLAGLWVSDEEEYGSDGEPLSPATVARTRKERETKLKKAKREEKRLKKQTEKLGPPTGGDEEEIVETIEGDDM